MLKNPIQPTKEFIYLFFNFNLKNSHITCDRDWGNY